MTQKGIPLDLVGRIVEIWRYPVSSIGGEQLPSAALNFAGLAGDRQYTIIDLASGLPAAPEKEKKWRNALHLTAKCIAGQLPLISFPDGPSFFLDDPSLTDSLSAYFGFPAAIATYHQDNMRYGFPLTQNRHQLAPLHLLTTASLDKLAQLLNADTPDSRRFRPTVLIETKVGAGFLENDWTGCRLQCGEIELIAKQKTMRCGMTLISQPGLEEDPEILRKILRHNKRNLGTYCSVERTGTIRIGDELYIQDWNEASNVNTVPFSAS